MIRRNDNKILYDRCDQCLQKYSSRYLNSKPPPRQIIIRILLKLLPHGPYLTLSHQGFDSPGNVIKFKTGLWHSERYPDDVHVVPTDLDLERLVAKNEPILDDLPTLGNELDYFFEGCRSVGIRHAAYSEPFLN